MNKIYYLKSCDTCKKIMKQIENINDFELQDIKSEPITEAQLEEMYQHTKSYEKLLNKRAQLYKERQLKDKNLTENDIKNLLLEHYTFLARPVIFVHDALFVGNSKTTVSMLLDRLKF